MARGCVGAIAVLLMAAGACAFSVPGLHVSRARLPASQALRLRVRSRPQLVVCQVSRSAVFRVPGAPYALHPPMTPPPLAQGGDLGKEFEQERKTREEMDRIFKRASDDLKAAAQVPASLL